MLRTTRQCRKLRKFADNLMDPHSPDIKNTGFKTMFRLWQHRQDELFRNIHEAQFEHLRRVYRRQYFEAYRANADEYIAKYNITKAATLAQHEAELNDQDAKRRDAMERAVAKKALAKKHASIRAEFHEREFFHWYERAMERLQQMAKIKYVTRDDLDDHIAKELNKYVLKPDAQYPLNFVGQMPLLEDEDLNVVAGSRNLGHMYRVDNPNKDVAEYEPPFAEGQEPEDAAPITADVSPLDAEAADRLAGQVFDQMADEELLRSDAQNEVEDQSQFAEDVARRQYVDRGRTTAGQMGRHGGTDNITPQSPTLAENRKLASKRRARTKRGSGVMTGVTRVAEGNEDRSKHTAGKRAMIPEEAQQLDAAPVDSAEVEKIQPGLRGSGGKAAKKGSLKERREERLKASRESLLKMAQGGRGAFSKISGKPPSSGGNK